MTQTKGKLNIVAVVTMCFIFAMISFVTNMAAPFGNIWKGQYEWAGMMGNMMNFAAYLFMGIPAGKMLLKVGYKKTTLIALATGFVGIVIQWLSSRTFFAGSAIYVYLLGAFVCGFCVCMLNTVVNPMLNILGGGGNRGNQLIQTGGTLNSLSGTLTPFLTGALIGTVTKKTSMADVAPLLFIAMGVFFLAFVIISMLNIPEPAAERKNVKYEHSALSFRHLKMGVVAIFFYVGIEIGIPSQLNFYLSDAGVKGAGILVNGALIGGAFAAAYWFLMMIGRFLSTLISGKVSTKVQMTTVSTVAILFVLLAIFIPKTTGLDAPKFIYNPESKTVGILVDNGMDEAAAKDYIANPTPEAIAPYLADLAESFDITVVKAPVCDQVPECCREGQGVCPEHPNCSEHQNCAAAPACPEHKGCAEEAVPACPEHKGCAEEAAPSEDEGKVKVCETELPAVIAQKLKESQETPKIPLSIIFLILCGLCTSVMWGGIYNLSVEGLGKYTEQASGLFMTMVVGGGIMPLIQDFLAKGLGYMTSYWLVIAMIAYILFFALVGSKNVNKDIPV